MEKIVIVGGGAAGLELAIKLDENWVALTLQKSYCWTRKNPLLETPST